MLARAESGSCCACVSFSVTIIVLVALGQQLVWLVTRVLSNVCEQL